MSVFREIDEESQYTKEDAGWADREIENLKIRLSGLKTAEAQLEKINLYLSEENHVLHNIPDRLLFWAVDYYQHKEYEKRHPELKRYDNNFEQLTELAELSETFKNSIQDEINKLGIFGYYEKIKDVVFKCEKYELPGNIRILDYLCNERKVLLLDAQIEEKSGKATIGDMTNPAWLKRFSEGLSVEPGKDSLFLSIMNHYKDKSFAFDNSDLMKGKVKVIEKEAPTWIISFFEVLETEGIIVNLTGKHGDLERHCQRIIDYFMGGGEFNKKSLKSTIGKRKNPKTGERFNHSYVDVIRAEIKKIEK